VSVIRGRARELSELDQVVAGATGGEGSVAVIEGPAGIGKSRLLESAAELGVRRGLTVASGRADELDRITPWLSLTRAFASTDPPILEFHDLSSAPERLDQRGAVLDQFRAALEQTASRVPLMILIDDLQWADQATVAALGGLPEQLFSYPIVWLLSRRPLPGSPALEALVARLEALGARRCHLEPLDEAAAIALAADVVGGPVSMQPKDLLRATGGNPLFIVEVTRGHHSHVPGSEHQEDSVKVMPADTERSLVAAVEAHVRSMSASAVEFLKVASVLGRAFTASEVSELSARPSAQLLSAVDEAIAAGVLVEEGDQLAFHHDVFRQVLYEAIPGSLQRSLHREAATMLRRNGASPTRQANQLVIGAEAGDLEAVSALHQAIGELVGTSPWAAADLAVRLVGLTAPDTEERATSVSMAVQLLAWAGRGEEARHLGERFLDTSSAARATEVDILLGVRRAWMSRHARPYPKALPPGILHDTAMAVPVRASLLAFEQVGDLFGNEPEKADAGLEEAAAMLAGTGGDLDASTIRPLWVLSAQCRGDFVLALERARRDMKLVAPTSQIAGVAVSESTVAACLGGLGRIKEGLRTVEKAMQAGESCGYPHVSVHCRCLRAAFFLDTGRIDDARAEAAAAVKEALDSCFLDFASLAITTFVESAVRSGDIGSANDALEGLPRASQGGSVIPEEFWAEALVAQAQGHERAAIRALQPAIACLADHNFAIASRHPGRLPQIVGLAMRQGDEEVARSVASAATRLARANGGVPVIAQVAFHARGLLERNISLLLEAYEHSRPAETRLLHAILTEDLGTLQTEHGRRSEAVTAFEEAFDLFSAMGARRDAGRVRAALRKLGVRKPQAAAARPDRGWESLTPAELSVVRVVGRGLTNRAAANELCVSPDTVNTHLRHAFTKLDIRSRVELARLVVTHDR
jgi:DNA-binding CsgD family transcriptional regulator